MKIRNNIKEVILMACLLITSIVFFSFLPPLTYEQKDKNSYLTEQHSDTTTLSNETEIFLDFDSNENYIEELVDSSVNKVIRKSDHNHHGVEIYGYMTLDEVSLKYDIPVGQLSKTLKIPSEHSNQRLGRLRKQYGFNLEDLRKYVSLNTKK